MTRESSASVKYMDIINLTYPPEGNLLFGHPRMDRGERAKIFAPFAALKGYEEAVEEVRQKRKEL